ncbi:hypothetical protein FE257_006986 [Aspergillus nanangensis]|uniref:Uncharacterized protein n=1 Tax=Aspergillus nanangensis TaxID=2582783 RepID=A0AAD4CNC4_ASPNN|nr:hypothetical protein FE257_006986 [Aspergillus nanangensis]
MDPDRPITQHPVVEKGLLNYELCANLHNTLWHIAWAGSTEKTEPYPPPTWWEYFAPPDAVASRLSPELTEFFKRAYYREDVQFVFYVIQTLSYGVNDTFENECRLRLPFGIGSAGWARLSDSGSLTSDWLDTDEDTPDLRDENETLYQPGINGYCWHRDVQFHHVLNNWAERVECGDWEVGPEGVLGGIDKFREADTKEHWRKYWIPPSWG